VFSVTLDGIRHTHTVAVADQLTWLAGDGTVVAVEEMRADLVRPDAEHSGDAELVSPMPGSVVAVSVADGDTVEVGAVVVAVEAMKMEHALRSPVAGVVELLVAIGDQVTVGQPLARIIATTESES
jgi:acetyl-CoA/propionyl-CoA carboxylase biotin carboxyl carrier protein